MFWLALALAGPAQDPASTASVAEPAGTTHALTVSVKSPPAGAIVEATAFGETRFLKDPGVGVHSTTFVTTPARFTHLELSLNQNGVHSPIYDGVIPLSDGREDVVSFVVTGGQRPSALRTTYAPSAIVRTWTDPVSVTRYGWAAALALYAAVLLLAATRRA